MDGIKIFWSRFLAVFICGGGWGNVGRSLTTHNKRFIAPTPYSRNIGCNKYLPSRWSELPVGFLVNYSLRRQSVCKFIFHCLSILRSLIHTSRRDIVPLTTPESLMQSHQNSPFGLPHLPVSILHARDMITECTNCIFHLFQNINRLRFRFDGHVTGSRCPLKFHWSCL